MTLQRLPCFVGVSDATVGACGLSMNLAVIPPGAASAPHLHEGFETAIYVVSGRVHTYHGAGLHESVLAEAGDFLFIPAGVPHQAVNASAIEPARAIVARNVAAEQESVRLYDPEADR